MEWTNKKVTLLVLDEECRIEFTQSRRHPLLYQRKNIAHE